MVEILTGAVARSVIKKKNWYSRNDCLNMLSTAAGTYGIALNTGISTETKAFVIRIERREEAD